MDDMNLLVGLVGIFAPLVAVGSSPFIALAVLSGAGWLLNAEVIPYAWIPMSEILMGLPISNMTFFLLMVGVIVIKYLLGTNAATEIINQSTIKRIESIVGVFAATTGAYMISRDLTTTDAMLAAGTDVARSTARSIAFSAVVAAFAFAQTTIITIVNDAIDALLNLIVAPIPGGTFLITNARLLTFGGLVVLAIFAPWIAAVVGTVILIVSIIVARPAHRMQRYYRNIYVKPALNTVFKSYIPQLVPKKLPRPVGKEFHNPCVCIEGYFMNKTKGFKKRERCWLVREERKNYLVSKGWFGRVNKLEITDTLCIEKHFRYVQLFTDWHLNEKNRSINFVIRREHAKNIGTLTDFGMFDVKRNVVDALPEGMAPA